MSKNEIKKHLKGWLESSLNLKFTPGICSLCGEKVNGDFYIHYQCALAHEDTRKDRVEALLSSLEKEKEDISKKGGSI